MRARILKLQEFFGLIDTLAQRLLDLEPEDMDDLRVLLAALSPPR